MECLSERTLSLYLDKMISESEREIIESHIAQCNQCLDMLVVAYEARSMRRKMPSRLQKRIKERFGLVKQSKNPEGKWLLGAIFFFFLSFIIKRYFLQFLIGGAILGFKWVMEGQGARRIIMIFREMKRKENEEEFSRKTGSRYSYK